jgi:UDP-N-acetylmuramoyl-L-alanyl-D-glutamate--2,6-diaminopimelate ligase
MPVLKDILKKVEITSITGKLETEILEVNFNSQSIRKGDLFVAIKGIQVDGHKFIEQAIKNGAVAIVCESYPKKLNEEITYVSVKDSPLALSIISSNYYGNPSGKLIVVAVTGTNGKTTIVSILFQLFRKLGYDVGLISTVGNRINDEIIPTTHTTPDALTINALLDKMVQKGCTHCFMEVSSHAIVQQRVAGLRFTGAIFSNVSHDHLDYHKTFEDYIKAKKKLFDKLPSSAFALVNVDDKRGPVLLQNTKALKGTYSLKNKSEYKAKIKSNSLRGLELEIGGKDVWFKLMGDFNAYNLLAAYSAAILLGEENDEVLKHLSDVNPAPGRFEQVANTSNITAIVDYAHTPDALQNVLTTINSFRSGKEKLITVIGCGGNRDKAKRPIMAAIACDLSTTVIFTSDNPRDEDHNEIIKDMREGITGARKKKTIVLPKREDAIKTACLLAEEGDIILVAGKGHEKYQEIKGVKYPFDDIEVVHRILNMFMK